MNQNASAAVVEDKKLHSKAASKIKGKAFIYIFLGLGSFLMIFPFVWMLLTSFKTNAEAMAIPPTIFPTVWNPESYKLALQSLPFGNLYVNTGLMIVFRVITSVFFSSMAGFAFAKLDFKFKKSTQFTFSRLSANQKIR